MAFQIDPDIEKVLRRLERSEIPWVGGKIRDFLSVGVEVFETSDEFPDDVPKRSYSREEQVEETIRLLELFTVMPFKMVGEAAQILGRLTDRPGNPDGKADGILYLLDEDRGSQIPVTDIGREPAAVERMHGVIQQLRVILNAPQQ